MRPLGTFLLAVVLSGCAHLAGVTKEQHASLEQTLVGREAWLKRDIVVDLAGLLPARTHVRILKLSFAPAVILDLQLPDGAVVQYNVNSTFRYNDAEVRQTISDSFVFSVDEYNKTFGSNVFTIGREGGGPPEWAGERAFVILTVPDGGNLAARVKNLCSEPVIIDWGLCSLVDLEGQAHRVIPGSTRGKDVGSGVPPSVVPPGAEILELLLPEDKVDLSGKTEARLFPASGDGSVWIGKRGSLLLGIRIGDAQEFQTCPFVVSDVKLMVLEPAQTTR